MVAKKMFWIILYLVLGFVSGYLVGNDALSAYKQVKSEGDVIYARSNVNGKYYRLIQVDNIIWTGSSYKENDTNIRRD